jgi:hypothetical protein
VLSALSGRQWRPPLALYKIRDERRRTFRMTLLIALTDGISGLARDDMSYTEKAKALLHALPRGWLPTLRVHLNVGNEGTCETISTRE